MKRQLAVLWTRFDELAASTDVAAWRRLDLDLLDMRVRLERQLVEQQRDIFEYVRTADPRIDEARERADAIVEALREIKALQLAVGAKLRELTISTKE